MDIREILERALPEHEPVRVVYHGGRSPGTVRTITPLEMLGDQVRARCHVSGQAKRFRIDRLEPAGESSSSAEYTGAAAPSRFSSVEDIHRYARDTLEGMGWVVEFEAGADHAEIVLLRRFKNGKVRKTGDVRLSWDRYTVQQIFDGERFIEQRTERSRPFTVWANAETSRSYSDLDKAAFQFMQWAEAHRP